MSFTLPKGTSSFALWARQLSFSFFFRSYSQLVSGVMIEFHILELYLAARLVYLLGLITARSARQEGREGEDNGSGRKIRTDRPVVYSHLLRSSLIDLVHLHQWSDPVVAFLYFTVKPPLLELICRARVCERDGKMNIWTISLNRRVKLSVPYRLQNQNVKYFCQIMMLLLAASG